jgi:hypothetical protein
MISERLLEQLAEGRPHAAVIHQVPTSATMDGVMSKVLRRPPGRAGRAGKPARRPADGDPRRAQRGNVPGEPALARPWRRRRNELSVPMAIRDRRDGTRDSGPDMQAAM